MNLPLNEMQEMIYDIISQKLDCGVYDAVPNNAEMPYVKIGEARVLPAKNKTAFGIEVVETLHVWGRYAGFKEINEIMDTLVEALKFPFSVTGYEVSLCGLNNAKTITDPDGKTRHGVIDLRFIVYKL